MCVNYSDIFLLISWIMESFLSLCGMGSNATFVAKGKMISNFRTLNLNDGFGYCEKMLLSTIENVAGKCFEGRINAFYS